MTIRFFKPMVLVLLVAGVAFFGSGPATSAASGRSPTAPGDGYVATVLRAADACEARRTREDGLREVLTCVRQLAPPRNAAQADIWPIVTNCLSAGWDKDSGFDDDAVNGCLEDHGVL